MKQSRFSLSWGVWLLALLMVNPSLQAAKKKRAVAKKEPVKAVVLMKDDHLRDKIDQEIADLRTDVYSRATWAALQKVKQEADDTAGYMKLVTFIGGGIGFVLGCVVAGLVAKRMGKSDSALESLP
jgi:hypothetical protein